jgi:hypothetical protein
MDKEEFHWICGVVQGWFSANLGSKISDGSQLSRNFIGHQQPQDITNRNQPLLFFHMDPSNSIVWTRKSFIGSLMPCRVGFQQNLGELYIFRQEDRCEARVGFQQNLGQKSVMDPSCQCNFLGHQQPQGT